MDSDLSGMTREQLTAEVQRLRDGIRKHRDATGHELCWHHPELWLLLPDATDPLPTVPEWPQFLEGCIRYRQSLDSHAPKSAAQQPAFQRLNLPAGDAATSAPALTFCFKQSTARAGLEFPNPSGKLN
jgi:hypothetical protein